jgi:hypothetical protein
VEAADRGKEDGLEGWMKDAGRWMTGVKESSVNIKILASMFFSNGGKTPGWKMILA